MNTYIFFMEREEGVIDATALTFRREDLKHAVIALIKWETGGEEVDKKDLLVNPENLYWNVCVELNGDIVNYYSSLLDDGKKGKRSNLGFKGISQSHKISEDPPL